MYFKRIAAICTIYIIFITNISAATVETIFGPVEEENQIILDLIDSKAMQRLKGIDQSGPQVYFNNKYKDTMLSRYDHSLGVYFILNKFGLSLDEQVAGLLHDVSHTVFSHLGDIIFQNKENHKESYQDDIFEWYLMKTDIPSILAKYNKTIKDINPKNEHFKALDCDFPDMNADRIEYNLHTALVRKELTKLEANGILNDLCFIDNKWKFNTLNIANKFAKLSLKYTRDLWGSTDNAMTYSAGAAMIIYAFDNKYLDKETFHFGEDKDVIEKLIAIKDPFVISMIDIIKNPYNYLVKNSSDSDIHVSIKMRGINPLMVNNKRLTELDLNFAKEHQLTKISASNGVNLKIDIPNDGFIKRIVKYNS